MKKAFRVKVSLDIRVIAESKPSLSNRKFRQSVIDLALDEVKMHPEEYLTNDNVTGVEADTKTPYRPKFVWAFFNKRDERLYQYGMFEYLDLAQTVLKKAQETHPDAGIHLKQVEI